MHTSNGSEPKPHFADVNDATLHYDRRGAGETVVFIHRGLMDLRMWDDVFDALAQGWHVVRYDLRGSGDSSAASGAFAHHDDLRGLLDALALDKAHLVGHSLGGAVALDAALAFPDRVRSLALIAPGVSGYVHAEGSPVREYQRALVACFGKMDMDAAVALTVQMWVDGVGRPPEAVASGVRERARAMFAAALASPPRSYLPHAAPPPALPRLNEIDQPTLILSGAHDVSDVHDTAQQIAIGIRGARLEMLSGVGHLLHMEQPDLFVARLRAFWAAAG